MSAVKEQHPYQPYLHTLEVIERVVCINSRSSVMCHDLVSSTGCEDIISVEEMK